MPTQNSGDDAAAGKQPPGVDEKWQALASRGLAVLLFASLSVDLAVSQVGLAVQFLGIKLSAPTWLLGMYGTVGAGVYAVGCFLAGRASDRLSRRIAALFIFLAGVVWVLLSVQKSPYALLALVPFGSGCLAFFWPPVQAWIGDLVPDGKALTRVLGTFNVLWTVGLMVGPVTCGYLWGASQYAPFLTSFALALLVAVGLLTVPTKSAAAAAEEAGDEGSLNRFDRRAEQYLPLAWLANFGTWYATGLSRTLFPKLGTEAGFSEVVIGWILFAMLAGQLVAFVALRQATWWHFRRLPLMVALLIGAAGAAGTALAHSPVGFSLALSGIGIATGITYVASLFYSLQAPMDQRGKRTGIHEAILGAGLSTGPLVGGLLGNAYG
ncbi:MAG: MFS transporter, partial [Armatimonadetes bacterium]|nr:MFS transporter [Armatimonadota bacterium]